MKGGAEHEIISAKNLTHPQAEQEARSQIRDLYGRKVIVTPVEAKMSQSLVDFARKGTFILKAFEPEMDYIVDHYLTKIDRGIEDTKMFQNLKQFLRDSVEWIPGLGTLFAIVSIPLDFGAAVVGTSNVVMDLSTLTNNLYAEAERVQLQKDKKKVQYGGGRA
jgi:hypothetical protein